MSAARRRFFYSVVIPFVPMCCSFQLFQGSSSVSFCRVLLPLLSTISTFCRIYLMDWPRTKLRRRRLAPFSRRRPHFQKFCAPTRELIISWIRKDGRRKSFPFHGLQSRFAEIVLRAAAIQQGGTICHQIGCTAIPDPVHFLHLFTLVTCCSRFSSLLSGSRS